MTTTVRFEVTGLNQIKLLNTLGREGITVIKLNKYSQKLMCFTVKGKEKTKTINILQKQGFDFTIVSEISSNKTFKLILLRAGLIVGMAATVALSVFASKFLWRIEITGNERVNELTIIRTLKDTGISIGQKKSFDLHVAEEALMNLSDISVASVQVVGTTLRIDIVESSVTTPEKGIGDIVSLFDAEITRITVNSGTSKVKIGDRVPIGSTLIEGVDYDTEGNPLVDVTAQGAVYGKVNFTYSEISSLSGGFVRTGKVIESTVIKLFGLNIGKEKHVDFLYESEKTVTQIGSFFPLYAETTRYFELTPQLEISLDKLSESIKEKAINNLVIKAGGSAIEATVNAVQIVDKVYKVTVHIQAEISIGGRRID